MFKNIVKLILVLTVVAGAQTNDQKTSKKDYSIIKYSDQLDIEGPIEKNVLFDGARRKIAQVILNDGKSLGDHTVSMPFMVFCVSGKGELILGENRESVKIEQGSLVTVEAGVPHDVIAKPDLSIVVIRFLNDQTMK